MIIFCGLIFFGLCLSILFERAKNNCFLMFLCVLLIFTSPVYIYKFSQFFWHLRELPSIIRVTYPIAMGTEGNLADGCDVTVFKLSKSIIKDIKMRRIQFFDTATQAKGRNSYDYRRYYDWKKTPTLPSWKVHRGEDSPVKCAVINDKLLNQITKAVMKKGAYYTGNSTTQLMVIPNLGFVVIITPY